MAKVFYDRAGKAHTIGEKKNGNTESAKKPEHKAKAKFEPKAKFDSDARPASRPQSSLGARPGARPAGRPGAKIGPAPAKSSENKSPWGKSESSSSGGEGRFQRNRFSEKGESSRGGSSRAGRGDSRGDHRGGRGEGRAAGGRGGFGQKEHRRPKHSLVDHSQLHSLKGIVDKNKRGSAFLIFDRRDLEDVFIPRFYLEQLFHGDRVEAFISDEGEIEDLKVLQHRFKEIFGRIRIDFDPRADRGEGKVKSKAKLRSGFLVYERKKAKEEVFVPVVPAEANEGDWVKAEVIFPDNQAAGATGQITAVIQEVIGPDLPAIYDIQMVAGEFNLKEHHSFEAVKQAESYTLEVPGKDEEGRTDLRHLPFMTIDGERARDFDDAVYVEQLSNKGFRLWVAIADVSHYVKEKTPLDDEAFARGTSVYFPERAFHMLPRALSEGLCSLRPNMPRLALTVSIEYSAAGEKGEIKLYDTIIESVRRATYTEIDAEKNDPKHAVMMALYKILKGQRHDRGSIDFEFPEAEVMLDEKTGEPTDIVVRERNDAHRLIEEFMIAANESVTEWIQAKKLPFIYRIHEEPSPEAIEKFKKLAKSFGLQLSDKGGVPRPKVLNDFIRTLKEHPAEPVLATALLRSMRQAIYSATHGEHYGLASEAYTHFTSPIRRYPDLVVHRQLRAALHREQNDEARPSKDEIEKTFENLNEIAEHCSYRERVASEADREAVRFKQIRLMAKHLGEEFDAKVNGLTEKGIFCQIWHPFCEGMILAETIGDDIYEFNEGRMIMAGRRTKRTFTIGQTVRIKVASVSLDTRRVEFVLISGGMKDGKPIEGKIEPRARDEGDEGVDYTSDRSFSVPKKKFGAKASDRNDRPGKKKKYKGR